MKKVLLIFLFLIFYLNVVNGQEKGLVAYWSFDEVGDIAKDYSGNGNDGKIIGAKSVKGIIGNALYFDGASYIDCGTGKSFIFSGDYSLEVWVKHSSRDSQIYISKWTGAGNKSAWWLGYYDNAVHFGDYYEGGLVLVKGEDISDDQWHYIVGVREGKTLSLYIDGDKVGEKGSPYQVAGDNPAPVKIGCFGEGKRVAWPFKGIIDEVRVYNRALSEKEIKEKYSSIIKKESIILEDFEGDIKERVKVATERGCNIELTSKEFVISGKNALKFNVTNQNIDRSHPPYFTLIPTLTDWKKFRTLSFYILILPGALTLHSQAEMLVQLHSTDWDGKTWTVGNTLWNFWFNVPTGKPYIVKLPISKIPFRDKVGGVFICATNTPGIYFIDKIELSTEGIKDVSVEEFSPPQGVFIPEWISISLVQEGIFSHQGIFWFNSDKPLLISLELNKPADEKKEKDIKLFDEKGNKLLEKKVIFEKGESKKEIPFSMKKISELKINIDNEYRIIKVRDVKGIVEENVKIVQERKRRGNPFYRGIISLYAGMIYKQDGSPDIDATIARIKDLGANCYTYLIYGKSDKELSALPEFCEKAAEEGIEVWVYTVPPSEAPIGRDKPISERKYPPYDMDYLKWAEKISEISLNHPNLTLWMIDDFDINLSFFTLDYTKKIYEKTKEINPKLLFGVCVYYYSIKKFVEKGYLPYFDAVIWGFQDNSNIFPDCGINPKSLSVEINDYYKLCPDKILIPCIYFHPHSSWPKGRPTRKYLEEAIEKAYNEAGICFVFTMPGPGSMQYEVVKNFTEKIKLKKIKYK